MNYDIIYIYTHRISYPLDSFRYFLKLQKSFITAVGIDWDFLVLPRELTYAIFMAFIVLLFLETFFLLSEQYIDMSYISPTNNHLYLSLSLASAAVSWF